MINVNTKNKLNTNLSLKSVLLVLVYIIIIIKILTWLWGFLVIFLYGFLWAHASLWELQDNKVMKNLQFWPQSLKVMLELIFNISNVGYLFLNDVKNGAVIWGLLFKGYQALSLGLNIILI